MEYSQFENGAAGEPRHGREGRRLSEREVSESNLVAVPMVSQRDVSTSLDMTIRFIK